MADEGDERIAMRDGSFESDVPLEALAATFGATFTVVSQVNPHVAPFYAHLQGRAGRPSGGRDRTGAWRGGFLLGALEVHARTPRAARTHVQRPLVGMHTSAKASRRHACVPRGMRRAPLPTRARCGRV